MASGDIVAKCNDGLDLASDEIGIAIGVAGIGYLDADRAGIDVRPAAPGPAACMPCSIGFAHHLYNRAVLMHEIMTGDLAHRVAKPGFRRAACLHARIVDKDDVRPQPLAARPEI